jgi:small subunit ribosomal protein S4
MARHTKITLKKRQKFGLAPESASIRRKNQVKPRKSAYGERLEQKQKLKLIYGVMEHQMTRYVREAFNGQEDAQAELMRKLENRLDNVVYRLGFGKTREQARQLVNHGHILVNGAKVDIPSYSLKPGQIVSVKEKTLKKRFFSDQIEVNRKALNPVGYLEYITGSGRVLSASQPVDFAQNVDISKVMEFYRKMI